MRSPGLYAATGTGLLCAALLVGCAASKPQGGSESHFLMACESDSQCGPLKCEQGFCTTTCETETDCTDFAPQGRCGVPVGSAGEVPMLCDVDCTGDSQCEAVGPGLRCLSGVCRGDSATTRSDAGTPAGDSQGDGGSRPPDAATALTCAPGCTPSRGYPVDETRGCVDTSAAQEVACICGDPGPMACRVRLSDGTPWVVPQLNLDPPEEWGMCDAARLGEASSSSCEYSHCEVPPASLCSPADFCATTNCGGLQFQDDGCGRRTCELDADCDDGDRCVALECLYSSFCSYSPDGVCSCSGVAACPSGRVCAPVSQAGPAGDWVSMHVTALSFGSPAGDWTVTTDGLIESNSGTRALSQPQLEELRRIVDGPELRTRLSEGSNCGLLGSDLDVYVSLELSTAALGQDYGQCLDHSSLTDAIGSIYGIVASF